MFSKRLNECYEIWEDYAVKIYLNPLGFIHTKRKWQWQRKRYFPLIMFSFKCFPHFFHLFAFVCDSIRREQTLRSQRLRKFHHHSHLVSSFIKQPNRKFESFCLYTNCVVRSKRDLAVFSGLSLCMIALRFSA